MFHTPTAMSNVHIYIAKQNAPKNIIICFKNTCLSYTMYKKGWFHSAHRENSRKRINHFYHFLIYVCVRKKMRDRKRREWKRYWKRILYFRKRQRDRRKGKYLERKRTKERKVEIEVQSERDGGRRRQRIEGIDREEKNQS